MCIDDTITLRHDSAMTSTGFRLTGAMICAVAVAPVMARPDAQGTTRVKIDAGEIEGVASGSVVAFKGIPFAAPPVGALRWKAPQPVAPWAAVRAAKEYGHDCMQEPFGGDAAPLGTPPDEDCLVLNVWTPAARGAKPRPVMFWIYGGGFVNGGSSPEVYDGSKFAEAGVVLVSANYRLGRFGFFAHPALTKEAGDAPLGNYAYLDQIEALKWVKRNISAFGGDPNNVTVFGESAGGASVNMLMTSPLARGLFHRAIVQSGGGRSSTLIPARTLASAEQIGVAFAAEAGVTGDDAKALEALRALPAARLVNGMNLMKPQPKTNSGPMIDGRIVVEDTEAAFRAGRQAKVPYMIGANDLEFGFFPTPAPQVDQMLARFGDDKDKAVAAYDPQGTGNKGMIGMSLASDISMVEPARMLARLHAAAGQPTWHYRFSYVASSLRGKAAGALHATEIPFVFSTVRAKYKDATTPEDEAAGRAATAYWVAFAASGNPNTKGQPEWPRYTADGDRILDFTLAGPAAKADPWKARLDLVEELATKGTR
jgi:para-nitrobenzyl esterase